MIVIAIPFGLELDVVGALATLGLLALVALAFALLSYTLALVVKTEDALAPIVQGVALPLLLLSGILLPMELAPDWLQTLSNLNPLTHAVDAARALFNGLWGDPEIAIGRDGHGRHDRRIPVARLARLLASQRLTRSLPAPVATRRPGLPRGGPGVSMSARLPTIRP